MMMNLDRAALRSAQSAGHKPGCTGPCGSGSRAAPNALHGLFGRAQGSAARGDQPRVGITARRDQPRVGIGRGPALELFCAMPCSLVSTSFAVPNTVNQNYNFLQFSQDFSREKYCVFLFGKLRGCSPGVPRAYPETSALAH